MIGEIFKMDSTMKKYFSFFCATVALLLSACNKQENDVSVPSPGMIRFVAESIETRTTFGSPTGGKYPTLWTTNKDVKVAVNYTSSKDVSVTPSSDSKTAKFEAELNLPEAGPYTFMALSPATASVALSAEHKSWNVNIPAAQTPLTGSVDEDAQIIAAVSSAYEAAPDKVSFQFKHVTAYGHFSIKNLNLSGAAVQSVSLTSSVPFAGRWYYYPEDGTVQANSASSTITLTTTSVNDVWFACAPADLSGATLKVTVATDKGSFEKTVTCPASANLASGDVFKFAVDFSGIDIQAPQKYILVTDPANLTPGSKVIIANQNDEKAISTTQNGNNRGVAGITVASDGSVSDPADDVQIFVIEEGTADGSVAFKCVNGAQADKYIYAASSSSNYLRSQDNLDGNASWIVEIDANGIATIVAQGTNTRNVMRYNTTLVSAYAPTSSVTGTLSIYKLEGSGGTVSEKTPISTPKNIVATLNASTPNAIDVVWDAVTEADYYEVTATPETGDAVTNRADEESITITGLAFETKYTVSVVAYPSDTQHYKKSEPGVAANTVTTGTGKGSLSNPYTASEATAAVIAAGAGVNISNVHVTGIVSQIDELLTSGYGNATYYISDDGTTTDHFEIYRGFYLDGAKFSSEDQLKVGDRVIVYGTIVYFKGTTPEMTSGGHLVSIERDGEAKTFGATVSGTTVSAETTEVTVTVTGNVDWTASVTGTGATVAPNSGTGAGSVKVTFPENTSNADKTFTVSVSTTADVAQKTFSFTITQSKPVSGKNVVFEVGEGKDIISIFPAVKDGIKFEYAQGEGGNAPVFYSPFRWYKNNTVTISGATIKQVVFTFDSEANAKTMTPDSGNYVLSGTEGTWTGEASSVVFTNGEAAARFTQVKVVYEGTGSETVGTYTPTIAFASSNLSIAAGQSTDNPATTNSPVAVVYSSSNDAVATVSDKGKITAVAEGTATITASVAAVDGTCTKINGASATSTVTVTAPVAGQFAFDFTDKTAHGLDSWPTGSSTAAEGSYTYVLDGNNYSFTTTKIGNGIYVSNGYLMINSGNYLGLPAIAGKKLVSVSATLNGNGSPSTAAKGTITSDTTGTLVTGGEEQTFDTKGGAKTFDLTGTSANTVYYLAISNKNFQCTKIVLTYE
jgi:hypothetical protein